MFLGNVVGLSVTILIWKSGPPKPTPQLIALAAGAAAQASAVSFVVLSKVRRIERTSETRDDDSGALFVSFDIPTRRFAPIPIETIFSLVEPRSAVERAPKRSPPVA